MKNSLAICLTLLIPASLLAEFIPMEVILSDSVRGLDEGAPHKFVINAQAFEGSFRIEDAKEFHPPFISPETLIARGTWLQRSGDFSGYRSHVGKPPGLSEELLSLMTSDEQMGRMQESFQDITHFQPLFLVKADSEDVCYFLYRLYGPEVSVIYISSVRRGSDDSYEYHGGSLENPEMRALFTAMVQEEIEQEKCVTIKPK